MFCNILTVNKSFGLLVSQPELKRKFKSKPGGGFVRFQWLAKVEKKEKKICFYLLFCFMNFYGFIYFICAMACNGKAVSGK